MVDFSLGLDGLNRVAFSLDRIFELVFKRIGIFSLAFAQDLLDFDYLAFIKDNVDLSNGLVF